MTNTYFKPLDNDNVKLEVLRLRNERISMQQIAKTLGIPYTSIHRFLSKNSHHQWWSEHDKPLAAGNLHDHHSQLKSFTNKHYILTSAQNNTFVHRNFWAALQVMAKRYDAKILVGTFSYNKNGFQNLQKDDGDWFDPLVVPHICSEPIALAPDLVYCGELNILPTAVTPLSGLHSYTKGASGIFPHAKVQMEAMPRQKGESPRHLYTTGTVTQRNYIEKKEGQKASFHHVFGALFVEIDEDGDWFARQLIAETETGHFFDLDTKYTQTGFEPTRVIAINHGDIHAEKVDPNVIAGAFVGKHCMVDTLRPQYQFVHDVCDFSARNHHNINDPYFRFGAFVRKQETVEDDIKTVCDTLGYMVRPYGEVIVVESNHDLALKRWLKTADYKTDPANALFFLELQFMQYKSIADGRTDFSIFEYAVKSRDSSLSNIRFLRTDESFKICGVDGIECGSHGDLGPNGAKGSAQAFTKLGSRYNLGHSHSARIIDGVYQAGTYSKLDMGYNQGASSWSHSAIITHRNGKRQIVTFRGYKWRAKQ